MWDCTLRRLGKSRNISTSMMGQKREREARYIYYISLSSAMENRSSKTPFDTSMLSAFMEQLRLWEASSVDELITSSQSCPDAHGTGLGKQWGLSVGHVLPLSRL